ncbi:hypothetical protein R2601_03508 [Salipiger bermudensis HTCC2601]|uniref:Uncharacterized protein n=1 Tax=Salipiger bermudensis (strain DSM 26914 / JCM 13377 / KCTC 12554 / HTCC2601) TaxID=314265 RepID=Q0FWE4_SALBH|nr:hypothetical protein R2601_03508 [Salipiger bermudensis HTCC2601]
MTQFEESDSCRCCPNRSPCVASRCPTGSWSRRCAPIRPPVTVSRRTGTLPITAGWRWAVPGW